MRSNLHLLMVCGAAGLALALDSAPAVDAQSSRAQHTPFVAGPIAIVPMDAKTPEAAPEVTGALAVSRGRAVIMVSGSVTAGTETTPVTLPRRGTLRVCATSTVRLTSDSSVPSDEVPGLLMALDYGAIEASFATGRNSDILLTPDFRILISGPGAVDVKVRLGQHGDTCVDNAGVKAPYVLVSSAFDGGAYRVQPGQRVMFQHGSLRKVVDAEKEPCGCPPAEPKGNEFPLAQSEGLARAPVTPPSSDEAAPPTKPLIYNSNDRAAQPATEEPPETVPEAQPTAPAPKADQAENPDVKPAEPKKKHGFFHGLKNFFKRIFGAE
jgi:hypothetical protein